MVGNDIVDLQLAKTQSNWQRKGFLDKQFTSYEQEIILNAKNPFQQVWLFWSMKEATYKCYTQQYQKRFFAPKKVQCKMTALDKGFVTINEQVFYTFSKVNSHFIHSIAQSNTKKRIDFQDFLIDERIGESEFVKRQLLADFQEKSSIQKNNIGVPYLHQDKKEPIPISISHHGSYGAFAYQKN